MSDRTEASAVCVECIELFADSLGRWGALALMACGVGIASLLVFSVTKLTDDHLLAMRAGVFTADPSMAVELLFAYAWLVTFEVLRRGEGRLSGSATSWRAAC